MPNFYAHLLYGREVSRRLPAALQRILLREWDSFCCGSFGPDPLYFYVGGRHAGAVRQAGVRLHHGTGRAAMECYRRPVARKQPCAVSFGAGYLLHYLLDSRVHPFVLKTVETGAITHFALEGEFDRYLLRRDGRAYEDAIPERPVTNSLLSAASCMAPEVTPEIYRTALKRFRLISCRLGLWAGTPVRYVVNAASYLPPARKLRGTVLGREPRGAAPELLREMEEIFYGSAPEAAELLTESMAALAENRPLPRGLDTDYSGKEESANGIH